MICGAAAIFHDEAGRVLLVQPTYRDDTWELPGGALEAGEDPADAVRREVAEELGIAMTPGRLLVVDWMPGQPDGRPPLANFAFDAGRLTEAEAEQCVELEADELAAWRLASPDEWDQMLSPHMARRVHACARALAQKTTYYLREGHAR